MRVGLGYDIHRLVPGRRFILGGVELAFDLGPEGHSDGDALLHALIDALLGAAALGDIGTHFPSSDERWAGADSAELLRLIVARIEASGLRIGNVDCNVILERPPIAAHTGEMGARIAAILGLPAGSVSVKAKTNDGLGSVGTGQAVAAQAIAALIEQET